MLRRRQVIGGNWRVEKRLSAVGGAMLGLSPDAATIVDWWPLEDKGRLGGVLGSTGWRAPLGGLCLWGREAKWGLRTKRVRSVPGGDRWCGRGR